MAFTHEIVDLANKPSEFLALHASLPGGGTGEVPLLEIDGQVVIESETIVRYIITKCGDGSTKLLPPGQAERFHVDSFIKLWTSTVEPRYYDVLAAPSENHAKYATAMFVEALIEVENALWGPRMAWS